MKKAASLPMRPCLSDSFSSHTASSRRAFCSSRWPSGSINHDLDAVARLDDRMRVEAVQYAKALELMVNAGHAMRQRLGGITGLHRDDLQPQRSRRLDFRQRQAAE